MKGSTVISFAALIISIIALALAVNTAKEIRMYDDYPDDRELDDWEVVDEEEEVAPREPMIHLTTSYKLEDRYTMGNIPSPELAAAVEGKVVIQITVDWLGHVIKTAVDPSSSIKDELIIEECRRAALKTRFNSKSSTVAGGNQKGSITFSFVEEYR